MAIKTKEQLLDAVREVLADQTSDKSIQLLEDLTDSFDAKPNDDKEKEIDELRKQLADNDKMWREKYTQRFFNPTEPTAQPIVPEQNPEPDTAESIGYDDLFN